MRCRCSKAELLRQNLPDIGSVLDVSSDVGCDNQARSLTNTYPSIPLRRAATCVQTTQPAQRVAGAFRWPGWRNHRTCIVTSTRHILTANHFTTVD